MKLDTEFKELSWDAFITIKEKFVFSDLRSIINNDIGEIVQSGLSTNGEKCTLFKYFDNTDKAEFLISGSAKNVYYAYTDAASKRTINSLIRGNITKFCLQHQGNFCLHAAGVQVDNGVILFTGHKTAGKSTLTAYFRLKGHTVWCDDYAVVGSNGGNWFAYKGDDDLKVTPETASLFNLPYSELQSVFTYRNKIDNSEKPVAGKYYFKSSVDLAQPESLPVKAVFQLYPRELSPLNIVHDQDKQKAFMFLLKEMMLPGVNSKAYIELYFKSAKRFIDDLPFYAVHAPDAIERIGEVYHEILRVSLTDKR
ncbi:hypothetical protein MUY27_05750 [Mucilaginibacter sp. RS28]|uniref:Uncharacterized protein n=1 Tax=Mucilaginibacter straminoryzae TaxID=2932774 RepID=A0A9X1X0X2_9SPHI|nr:hypothetical protein [Mucilaginibacter straminoryzae]MCJ8209202.1 hypothetical protein [Mucilaginibacter straminoryzae]